MNQCPTCDRVQFERGDFAGCWATLNDTARHALRGTTFSHLTCGECEKGGDQSARIAALEAENAALQSRYDACAEKLAAARHESNEADERANLLISDNAAAVQMVKRILDSDIHEAQPLGDLDCQTVDKFLADEHPGAPLLAELAALRLEVSSLRARMRMIAIGGTSA